jgi:hypothetical protein
LQKDNSYSDVGPGQYEPTRGPAIGVIHAPPQIPILNPRSRASASKMFTNSQLLPSATTKLDSTIVKSKKIKEIEEKDDIWWSTGQNLTIRKRPYGNYKGGQQKFKNDGRIQPAFIAENSFIVSNNSNVSDDRVERFFKPVPYPQKKQLNGPKHLPMRMHNLQWNKNRLHESRTKDIENDKQLVSDLGGLSD